MPSSLLLCQRDGLRWLSMVKLLKDRDAVSRNLKKTNPKMKLRSSDSKDTCLTQQFAAESLRQE